MNVGSMCSFLTLLHPTKPGFPVSTSDCHSFHSAWSQETALFPIVQNVTKLNLPCPWSLYPHSAFSSPGLEDQTLAPCTGAWTTGSMSRVLLCMGSRHSLLVMFCVGVGFCRQGSLWTRGEIQVQIPSCYHDPLICGAFLFSQLPVLPSILGSFAGTVPWCTFQGFPFPVS